jgi:hypothetical protein
MTPAPHWTERYLGLPYEEGGCFFLFQRVQRERFGREAPPLCGGMPDKLLAVVRAFEAASTSGQWRAVDRPIEGDAVLMSSSREPHHVGTFVALGRGRVLHSLRGQGSALPAIEQLATTHLNIVGFYRPAADLGD